MKCKFCGMEVDEKQRFCPNCGLLLDLSFTAYSVHSIQKAEGKEEKPFQEYSDKGTVNEDEAKSFVQETKRKIMKLKLRNLKPKSLARVKLK